MSRGPCHPYGSCEGEFTKYTDEAIKAIAASCPSLTMLNVGLYLPLTREAIKAIAAKCPSLTCRKCVGYSFLHTHHRDLLTPLVTIVSGC